MACRFPLSFYMFRGGNQGVKVGVARKTLREGNNRKRDGITGSVPENGENVHHMVW